MVGRERMCATLLIQHILMCVTAIWYILETNISVNGGHSLLQTVTNLSNLPCLRKTTALIALLVPSHKTVWWLTGLWLVTADLQHLFLLLRGSDTRIAGIFLGHRFPKLQHIKKIWTPPTFFLHEVGEPLPLRYYIRALGTTFWET